MKKMGTFKSSFSVILLAAVLSFAVLNVGAVSAAHTATITISPDVANCDQLGNTFTLNVTNDGSSIDDLLQVEIYRAPVGITNFVCGPAPTGWTLFSFTDRCIYVTELNSPDKIAPGASRDLNFSATMNATACASEFIVVTVDDKIPTGDRNTVPVQVKIDCTPPETSKIYGDPHSPFNINDNPGYPHWISTATQITLTANDDVDIQ